MAEAEHAFLRRLVGRLQAREARAKPRPGTQLLVGAGDDAALFSPGTEPFAVTTDVLVEGTHFQRDWLDAEQLGRRAVAVNASDLAAMAAEPRYLLAAVSAPATLDRAWLDALLDGCAEAAADVGAQLIGGNLSCAQEISITVTAIGTLPGRRLERSGARPGDALVVTGTLGDAAAAVAAWAAGNEPPSALRERWRQPQARMRAGIALAALGANACIDLSDGLLADLGHVCRASNVGAEIERARLPRSEAVAALDRSGSDFAARGGEDYELLLACPAELVERLPEASVRAEVPLTVIGRCTDRAGEIVLLDENRVPLPLSAGFDHFTPAAPSG